MIDFACKKFNIDEIIKCSLGLTRAEFLIFEFMIKNSKEYSAIDIAKKKSLDLSTVQRTLKKLADKDLVKRRQINLEHGGYIYSYAIKDKRHLKEKILEILRSWSGNVEKELDAW